MGALTRLLFFLQYFLSFCFQKGTVSLLRNVGYIPKACPGMQTVTLMSNSISDSPDSSAELESHRLSMSQLMSSSNLDTPKKKFVEPDREGRKQLLQTIQDIAKEMDQVSQTDDKGNETSKLPKTVEDAATVEAVEIAQFFSGRIKAEIDSGVESDSTSSSNEGEVYEQDIKSELGRRTGDNQQNERRINKNYGLFALVDAEEISQDSALCPQCNSPCDYEDITDFGKCTVCKQKDLRDPSVHRVRNSDDRISFFSNPADKNFRAREKIVAQPLENKEQNLLFEKLRREQEERLTFSPQTQTIPIKLKNTTTPPPMTENQNGRYNTNSGPESSTPDKKIIQKRPPGGVNIVESNPLSKQNLNLKNLMPSNNGQINTQSAEFTDSEKYPNLSEILDMREILDTEVFEKIDSNYKNIIDLMAVRTCIHTHNF
jgi:hypothetical protein